jgi:DNA-binding MarR family transcriptional regulator
MLDEREFELINIIGSEISSNQRDLSRKMNISLGMVNMLIRRLITKGYIRTSQLDKKKVGYILTPEGFKEKMQKSMKYTLKTINSIGLIKDRLIKLLKNLYDHGERKFWILGESDLTFLVEMVIKDLSSGDCSVTHITTVPEEIEGILLVCKEDVFEQISISKKIDLIHELAQDQALINNKA